MTLEQFILLPHRWQWGFCDCHIWPSDWVLEVTGKDPAAECRGTYFDAAGAHALLEQLGGVEANTARSLERLGFLRTSEPRDGDIGLVCALTAVEAGEPAKQIIPAIRFGPLWAVMSLRGPQVKALEWTGAAWQIA